MGIKKFPLGSFFSALLELAFPARNGKGGTIVNAIVMTIDNGCEIAVGFEKKALSNMGNQSVYLITGKEIRQ